MRLVKWSLLSLGLGWIGLTGCTLLQSKIEPFTCDVQVAYKEDGTVDTTAYQVNRACLRGVQARLNACYKE